MKHTQLTEFQRYQIYSLKKAHFSQSDIAREVGVHKSTISRELCRNTGLRSYRPTQAQHLALERRNGKKPVRIADGSLDRD